MRTDGKRGLLAETRAGVNHGGGGAPAGDRRHGCVWTTGVQCKEDTR